MIIKCNSCARKFIVKDIDIPKAGRTVQCGYCSVTWHQMPNVLEKKVTKKINIEKKASIEKSLSVDAIKASDGKTYKFLGSQWAELLPSGKTGIFAKKKIGKELDKLTGRKIESVNDKKRNKTKKELDPSSQSFNNEGRLPDIYRPKQNLGFFGYIFLFIVIGFSLIGVFKTFEKDLINNFPESEFIFFMLNEQIEFLAESVKNMIVIIKDLLNSY